MRKHPTDWFEELPEPYRSAAIEGYTKHPKLKGNFHDSYLNGCNSLEKAICSFKWGKTVEGWDFWGEVEMNVRKGISLPPYPYTIEDLCSVLDSLATEGICLSIGHAEDIKTDQGSA